jgi:hypothetical protein
MPITPEQRLWQRRFESLIGFAAPALDLLLTVGNRASRILQPGDDDYYPIRPAAEAFELDGSRDEGRRGGPSAPID